MVITHLLKFQLLQLLLLHFRRCRVVSGNLHIAATPLWRRRLQLLAHRLAPLYMAGTTPWRHRSNHTVSFSLSRVLLVTFSCSSLKQTPYRPEVSDNRVQNWTQNFIFLTGLQLIAVCMFVCIWELIMHFPIQFAVYFLNIAARTLRCLLGLCIIIWWTTFHVFCYYLLGLCKLVNMCTCLYVYMFVVVCVWIYYILFVFSYFSLSVLSTLSLRVMKYAI